MARSRDDFHLARGNILPHQIRLRRTRQDVLITGDEQGGHVDGLQVGHRIRPLGHALLYLGDVLRIMRSAPSTRSGRLSRVVLPSSLGTMLSKNGVVPRCNTSAAACKRLALASGESDGAFVLNRARAATRPRYRRQNSNNT